MTMEIVVKNNSENYIGKVVEVDHYENNMPSDVGEHILNPGESKSFYVYASRSIRVEEVEEIIEKQQEPVSPPPDIPRQMG